MADEELARHLFTLLTVGPEAWNEWRRENPKVKLDFSGHRFEGILAPHLYDLDLSGVDLSNAEFRMGNLSRTNLTGADARYVELGGAILDGANFTDSSLRQANLGSASIKNANFSADNEINAAFEKEQLLMKQRGRKVLALVPLNLDGYMFSGKWKSGKTTQIKSRLAADFTGWQSDNEKFDEQVNKLVRALRADAGGRETPPMAKL